jgi:flagellar basal-body rod modification protein FlgD
MAVNAIGSSGVAAGSTGSSAGGGFNQLSSSEFMKIITTELTRQDPLKPNDTNTLLNQISGIRNIESQLSLSNSLEKLVGQNSFASASGLLGASISGVGTKLNGTAARVAGLVLSVAKTKDGPVLTLDDGSKVAFSNVDNVSVFSSNGPPSGTGGTGTTSGTGGTGTTGGTGGTGTPPPP